MNLNDEYFIKEILKSQISLNSELDNLTRDINNTINYVLKEAESTLGKRFKVYWIRGGIPNHFCLLETDKISIAYNVRLIELFYLMRIGYNNDQLHAKWSVETWERIGYKMIADYALREKNTNLAVSSFIQICKHKSNVRVTLPFVNNLAIAQMESLNSGYFVKSYFGLMHELGHSFQINSDDDSEAYWNQYNREVINRILKIAINRSSIPEKYEGIILDKAIKSDKNFILNFTHLKEESIADVFAITSLYKSTRKFLKTESEEELNYESFMMECYFSMFSLYFINICKFSSKIHNNKILTKEEIKLDCCFHSIAIIFRIIMIDNYILNLAIVHYTDNRTPNPEIVNRIKNHLQPYFLELDNIFSKSLEGVNNAIECVSEFNLEKNDVFKVFEREHTNRDFLGKILLDVELKEFLELAKSYGIDDENTGFLERMINTVGNIE